MPFGVHMVPGYLVVIDPSIDGSTRYLPRLALPYLLEPEESSAQRLDGMLPTQQLTDVDLS